MFNSDLSTIGAVIGGTLCKNVTVPNSVEINAGEITLQKGIWIVQISLWVPAPGAQTIAFNGSGFHFSANANLGQIPIVAVAKVTSSQKLYIKYTWFGTEFMGNFAGIFYAYKIGCIS